jgi:tRNA U34 5-methylaminomethyl-2-thiouridine-forming methyltransferase MnmC
LLQPTKTQLVITGDGSHSLRLENDNEHYHSLHGAIQESLHVYIRTGLHYLSAQKKSINILEVGFGTGLNALLTLIESKQNNVSINYYTLEPEPISEAIATILNFTKQLNAHDCDEAFLKMHSAFNKQTILLSNCFYFQKAHQKLEQYETEIKFDLIYFDAFAPLIQPELWTIEVFSKIYKMMNVGACLVTYCAKGEVKRNLKNVGFVVQSLPGPKGKREMVRAIKQ